MEALQLLFEAFPPSPSQPSTVFEKNELRRLHTEAVIYSEVSPGVFIFIGKQKNNLQNFQRGIRKGNVPIYFSPFFVCPRMFHSRVETRPQVFNSSMSNGQLRTCRNLVLSPRASDTSVAHVDSDYNYSDISVDLYQFSHTGKRSTS